MVAWNPFLFTSPRSMAGSSSRYSISFIFNCFSALLVTGLLYLVLFSTTKIFAESRIEQIRPIQSQPEARAARSPAIFVQGGLVADAGSLINVPIAFDSGGNHVASLSFSFDYDAECLSLPLDDRDNNRLPDAIVIDAPAQFIASIQINAGNQPGRLNVILADYIPPLAALQDTAALITLQFRIICPVAPRLTHYAYVRFAELPAVGFSGADGRDLPGAARAGVVQVNGDTSVLTPAPSQTPTPVSGSPTPTLIATVPNTPTPPPLVALEIMASPERITQADRSVIFVLDYVVLSGASNIALSIIVPQHTYFDAAASTVGWQCGTDIVNRQCLFPIYEATRQNNLSGRLFFAVALNWPLPASVTQIEFTATVIVNSISEQPIHSIIIPMVPLNGTPLPEGLTLNLYTDTKVVEAGRNRQLFYTLTYTNTSATMLNKIEFHLLLPLLARFYPTAQQPLEWTCPPHWNQQQECIFSMDELQPGTTRQEPFLLEIAPFLPENEVSALTLVVYAVSEGKILSSDSSIVSLKPSSTGYITTFLPFVVDQLLIFPDE